RAVLRPVARALEHQVLIVRHVALFVRADGRQGREAVRTRARDEKVAAGGVDERTAARRVQRRVAIDGQRDRVVDDRRGDDWRRGQLAGRPGGRRGGRGGRGGRGCGAAAAAGDKRCK